MINLSQSGRVISQKLIVFQNMKEEKLSISKINIAIIFSSVFCLILSFIYVFFGQSFLLSNSFNFTHSEISYLTSKTTFIDSFKLPYSEKWEENQIKKFSEANFCPSCKFKLFSSFDGNSSPDDLIIVCNTDRNPGIIPFMRTLRMTSSKATVCFLTFNYVLNDLGEDTPEILEKCGANLINFGDIDFLGLNNIATKWKMIDLFLNEHGKEFKRILLAHSEAVIFQGDPFNERIEPTGLYFLQEESQIVDSKYEQRDFLSISYDLSKYLNEKILTSNLVFGALSELKILANILVTYSFPLARPGKHYEPAFFMYAAYYLIPKQYPQLKVIYLNQDDGYVGLAFYTIKDHRLKPGAIQLDNDLFPPVIFNYQHRRSLLKNYFWKCPNKPYRLKHYLEKLPDNFTDEKKHS